MEGFVGRWTSCTSVCTYLWAGVWASMGFVCVQGNKLERGAVCLVCLHVYACGHSVVTHVQKNRIVYICVLCM